MNKYNNDHPLDTVEELTKRNINLSMELNKAKRECEMLTPNDICPNCGHDVSSNLSHKRLECELLAIANQLLDKNEADKAYVVFSSLELIKELNDGCSN